MRAGILLALGATALTLLCVEIALRAIEGATGFDFFHVMLDERTTSPTTELRLIDLIRLSPDPELIYELAPRIRGRFKGTPIAIGDRGARVPEDGAEPDGELRLIGIGDSHTFGWGVAWRDTFLARIADRFAREHAGRRVAVTNLGVPGYNTHQEAEVFAAKALALHPDAVVLLADQNDAGLANFIRAPLDPWSLDRSYLVDFVEIRAKRLLRANRFRNRFLQQGLLDARRALGDQVIDGVGEAELERLPPEVRHMVGVGAVASALDRIAALAREHGIPVVIAFYDEPGDTALRDLVSGRAKVLGLPMADLAAPVAAWLAEPGHARSALVLSESDHHPTPLHHGIIADALYEQQLREILELRITRR
ncbi:MAG TPA: SGNH/GDSL hydrolase family protein [Myxococcota bacterium]|nr:SGNH/GDSL hydrolase family protein [Myxococcota bacterium]